VEGTITAFTSSSKFSVNGLPVDASGATVPAGLKLGDRVEVEGKLVAGVLVAKKVALDDEKDPLRFELHGIVATLNTTTKTFVVRGVTVDYSAAEFRNGTITVLLNGARIEVKGVASADGTKVKATRISFE
jgi:type II secretory pathway component PulC